MGERVGISQFAGEEDHVAGILAFLVDRFYFLQVNIYIFMENTSEIMVFNGFVDDIHGFLRADNADRDHGKNSFLRAYNAVDPVAARVF